MAEEIGTLEQLLPNARFLVSGPSRGQVTFPGYGVKPGEKVLIAVNNHYHELVVKAIATAIREVGARVDVVVLDSGPNRELDELDEIRSRVRDRHWSDPDMEEAIRGVGWGSQAGRLVWIEELGSQKYDLLIYGVGGSGNPTKCRYEGILWFTPEMLASPAVSYPYELREAIDSKTWNIIWNKGRGAKVRVTDPEGTDVTYTLSEKYFDGTHASFSEKPHYGHLMGHPGAPLLPYGETTGVVSGTTNHASCPYPNIKVYLENGMVTRVVGGGKYGDNWRELIEITKDKQYPDFPGKGLFWLFEVAIGTNPKQRRPKNAFTLVSGGTMCERLRSGVIHYGFGTAVRWPPKEYVGEKRWLWGHLHVHNLFPTYEMVTPSGEQIKIVDRGHFTILDDPEIRKLASKYGDPDKLLRQDWAPPIPGISVQGDYGKDYASAPFDWVKVHG